MLKRTFIHLTSVGPATEAHLWREGVSCWDEFLAASRVRGIGAQRLALLQAELAESLLQLDNPGYFGQRLPSPEMWRLYRHYRQGAAFLDIETSGAAWPELTVTVVGLYDGREFQQFVWGENLNDFRYIIDEYDLLVTFNGLQFDVPVLRACFPGLRLPPVHIDLRFVLARLGYKGGLKRIEPQLGVQRPPDLEGLDGYDAVLLWERAQQGDPRALDLLLRYNREDVINLEYLMEKAYGLGQERLLGLAPA